MCFRSICFHFRVNVAYALSDCLTFDIAWLQGEASLFNFSELSIDWKMGCYLWLLYKCLGYCEPSESSTRTNRLPVTLEGVPGVILHMLLFPFGASAMLFGSHRVCRRGPLGVLAMFHRHCSCRWGGCYSYSLLTVIWFVRGLQQGRAHLLSDSLF